MNKKEVASDPFYGIWKFFASVRLTIILLLSLAATSILGTVIPQNESPAAYLQAYGEVIYRILATLDLFDMYHSWWFQLLAFLLTLNIVICSIDRLQATWKIIFPRRRKFNVSRFRQVENREEFTVEPEPEQLEQHVIPAVGRMFSYHRVEHQGNGFLLLAEKWRWTRLGVYIVHFSVILLLCGGLIGSIFGFDGFVSIPEGESVDAVQHQKTGQPIPLGFEIRCDDFNLSLYDTGQPKEYRSQLTILENGQPVLQQSIVVNKPLRYKGINIFQSSYGQLPPTQRLAPPKHVRLSITSKETGMVYTPRLAIGQAYDIPENLGKLTVNEYRPDYGFRGQELGPTLIGTLVQADGSEVEVVLPLRFPSFDRMSPMFSKARSDAVFISAQAAQSAQDEPEVRYYTGLQVTKDPGVWVVYSGFILMILGCIITFFMSHQQLCIEVLRKDGATRVMIAGTAAKGRMGMVSKVKRIGEMVQAQFSRSPNQPL